VRRVLALRSLERCAAHLTRVAGLQPVRLKGSQYCVSALITAIADVVAGGVADDAADCPANAEPEPPKRPLKTTTAIAVVVIRLPRLA